MKEQVDLNLLNRSNYRLSNSFKVADEYRINFIKHSDDSGVILNGGRAGSKYAPTAILNQFKKMSITDDHAFFCESEYRANLLTTKARSHLFIGGGHDHVRSAILDIAKKNPKAKIVILNIDPHTDTRTDAIKSSGTPFRELDLDGLNLDLIQLGTLDYANFISSSAPLKHINQKIISMKDLEFQTEHFTKTKSFFKNQFIKKEDAIYFLSLDADAIVSSEMPAVSAVNYHGVPTSFVRECFKFFKDELHCQHFGIYEYNPLYEGLNQIGLRNIVSIIHELI